MKEQILNIIQQLKGGVSFVQLEHRIEGFSGDLMWGVEGNIFFWFSLSQEAINALESLNKEGLIELKPTQLLVYLIDGAIPDAPIAKQHRKYKSPHWLPIVFNLPKTK